MKKSKYTEETDPLPPEEPALTPEARENQLISLSERLAEKQLREGTASAQVIVHYLRLGSQREKLEREKLRYESMMLEAKTEALKSSQNVEHLYAEAMEAFRRYSGYGGEDY